MNENNIDKTIDEKEPPKKITRLKIKIIIFVVSLLAITLFFIKLPSLIKDFAINKISITTGRTVESDDLKYNYLHNILTLDGFVIYEKDKKKPFVSLDSLKIDIDLIPLFKKELSIREITLVNPSVNIQVENNTPNYKDILENIQTNSNNKEEVKKKEEPFKRIIIEDITVDNFIFKYEDTVIQGKNTFTFKSPRITYEENILDFSSKIKFILGGSVDIRINYNTKSSDFFGNFTSSKLDLEDKLYLVEGIYNLEEIKGTLDSELLFNGNIKKSDFSLNGDLQLDKFIVSDTTSSKLLSFDRLLVNIEEIDTLQSNYKLENITFETLDIDTVALISYLSKTSKESQSGDNKKLNLSINKIGFSNSSINTTLGLFKDIDGDILDFTPTNFNLNTNFNIFDITVAYKGDTLLDKDFNFSKKSIISNGNITISGEDLDTLSKFVGKDQLYSHLSNNYSSNFEYSYKYPILDLTSNISIDALELLNFNSNYPKITISKLSSSNNLVYSLLDNKYVVNGSITSENLDIFNSNDILFSSVGDISITANNIDNELIDIDSLTTSNLSLDLRNLLSVAKEDKDTPIEDNKLPTVSIKNLFLEGSEVIHPNFSTKFDIEGAQISNLKGRSKIKYKGTFNKETPFDIRGDIIKSQDISSSNDLNKIGFDGDISIKNLNLREVLSVKNINNFTGDAILTLNSKVTYLDTSLKTNNFLFIEGLNATYNDTRYKINSLTSKNLVSFIDKKYNLKGDIKGDRGSYINRDTSISFEDLNISVLGIDKRSINIDSILINSPSVSYKHRTDKQKKKEPKKPQDKPSISINSITVNNGRFKYINPEILYEIRDTDITLDNFTTKKGQDFTLNISSKLTGSGSLEGSFISSLNKDYDFSPTGLNSKGEFFINNLDILDFRNFLDKRLPNEIDSGRMNYRFTVDLENGKFKGENKIDIKKVYIGKSTDIVSTLPLKLAVSILSDKDRNLLLDVPISGDFNNPKFQIYKVVLQAIKNILIKAVTSPINILAKTFSLGSEDLDKLYFEPLQEELSKKSLTQLDKLADLLNNKEEVYLTITIFTNQELEETTLNERLKEKKIFKRDEKPEILKAMVGELIIKRRNLLEGYFEGRLLGSRVTIETSDITRDRSQASVDIKLDK